MRVLLILVFASSLVAATPVRELALAARSYPAEFAADAMLRLAAAADGENSAWRAARIEEAFQLSFSAGQTVRRTARAVPGQLRGIAAFTYGLGLDAMSLQTRAVQQMLTLNPRRAVEMFQAIPAPVIAVSSCENNPVAELSTYYQTLRAVVEQGFSSSQRRHGAAAQLLLSSLSVINSPLQLGPAAQILAEGGWTDTELYAAAAALAEAFSRIGAADADFTAALTRDRLLDHVSAAVANLEARRMAMAPFVESFRRFLVAHLAAPRCAASVSDERFTLTLRERFNSRFSSYVTPLRIEEITPSRVEPQAPPQASDTSALALHLRTLRTLDRGSREFHDLVQQTTNEIESWDASGIPAAEIFHRKAGLFEALSELLPPGEQRASVLGRYAAFVTGSRVAQDDPVAWYGHARILAGRLRRAGAWRLTKETEASAGGLLAYLERLNGIAPLRDPGCSGNQVCTALSGPDAWRAEILAFLLN